MGGWRRPCHSPIDSGRFLHRLHSVLLCFSHVDVAVKPSVGKKWRASGRSVGNVYDNKCTTDCANKCTDETGRAEGDSTTLMPMAQLHSVCATAVLQKPSSSVTTLLLMTDDDNFFPPACRPAIASVCFRWSTVIAHKRPIMVSLMPEAAISVGIICSTAINQPGWTPAGFSGALYIVMFTSLLVKNDTWC